MSSPSQTPWLRFYNAMWLDVEAAAAREESDLPDDDADDETLEAEEEERWEQRVNADIRERWALLSPAQQQAWMPAPELTMAEERAVRPATRTQWLQSYLAEATDADVFVVGGSIDLHDTQSVQLLVTCSSGDSSATPPPSGGSLSSLAAASMPLTQPVACWQLSLPATQPPPVRQQLMQAIIAQCEAAAFETQTELRPTNCSAYHLPPSRFVTSFNPAQPGCSLLADVARRLCPSAPAIPSYIQAELCSLNIYTAGGPFTEHVDPSPRADNVFGSLIVCLPVPHQGGQMTVRRGEHCRVFDWSFTDHELGLQGKQLQWAAFLDGCEHEVAAVTAGYRCTLMYNLYQQIDDAAAPPQQQQPAAVTSQAASLDRRHLPELPADANPLVRELREMLADKQWMKKGGVLGIKCKHTYAHTSEDNKGVRVGPAMLKGIDAAVYSSLVDHLHMRVEVKLVSMDRYWRRYDEYDDDEDEESDVKDEGRELYVCDVMHPTNNHGEQFGEHFSFDEHVDWVLPNFARFDQRVTWLNADDDGFGGEIAVCYGVDDSSDCVHSEVALLVHVLLVKQRRSRKRSGQSSGGAVSQPKSKAAKEQQVAEVVADAVAMEEEEKE